MSKDNRRLQRLLESKSRMCIFICAVLVLLISLWQIFGKPVLNAWRADNIEKSTKSLYYSDASSIRSYFLPIAHAESDDETSDETEIEVHEDFAALYEENPHTIGWLKGGAGIDYPVMYYDNSYYLDHDFHGNQSVNGTLFINMFNTLNPRDDVILIHGHNMKSGAMFGDLMNYESYDYACQNPIFTFRMIDDPEDVYYAPVFAFNASMTPSSRYYFDIMQTVFPDDEADENVETDDTAPKQRVSSAYSTYLQSLAEHSLWKAPIEVDVEDQLLMLVTCSYYHDDGRFMLVCRRLRETESPEDIIALYSEQ